jgi:hypothetical protein
VLGCFIFFYFYSARKAFGLFCLFFHVFMYSQGSGTLQAVGRTGPIVRDRKFCGFFGIDCEFQYSRRGIPRALLPDPLPIDLFPASFLPSLSITRSHLVPSLYAIAVSLSLLSCSLPFLSPSHSSPTYPFSSSKKLSIVARPLLRYLGEAALLEGAPISEVGRERSEGNRENGG